MSGLLKPMAAKKLIEALKNEISIPIHLHTHDTSGNGVATLMMAANAGVDIIDAAFNSMSGLTSQPALNSIVAATGKHRERYRHRSGRNPGNHRLLGSSKTCLQGIRIRYDDRIS